MSINTASWRRQWHPTPVLLPGKSHGWRSLEGCSPWGRSGSDTTERLHFHFSLSCIGEGNGNPLQRSCLENPRDGGAWWAAIYEVAQSRTRLKRLSSSNNTASISLKKLLSSVQPISSVRLFATPWSAAGQALPCLSPTPRDYSNSRPSSRWCHPTISSSVVPFSCLQSFPALGFFPMSWFFAWGGQNTGVSALASCLPMNIQDLFPLVWTGWIPLQSKGLSRVFSNTTVQKHQFFSTQLSL